MGVVECSLVFETSGQDSPSLTVFMTFRVYIRLPPLKALRPLLLAYSHLHPSYTIMISYSISSMSSIHCYPVSILV